MTCWEEDMPLLISLHNTCCSPLTPRKRKVPSLLKVCLLPS